MRFLTPAECELFGSPGSQNEVTPHRVLDGNVFSLYIYTQHVSGWREPRLIHHDWPAYGRLVEAADKMGWALQQARERFNWRDPHDVSYTITAIGYVRDLVAAREAAIETERKRCLAVCREDAQLGRMDISETGLAEMAGARILAAERIALRIKDPSIPNILPETF